MSLVGPMTALAWSSNAMTIPARALLFLSHGHLTDRDDSLGLRG